MSDDLLSSRPGEVWLCAEAGWFRVHRTIPDAESTLQRWLTHDSTVGCRARYGFACICGLADALASLSLQPDLTLSPLSPDTAPEGTPDEELLVKILTHGDVTIGREGPKSGNPGRPFLGLDYSTVTITEAEAAALASLLVDLGEKP